MVDISKLTAKDIGKRVKCIGANTGKAENGIIKSWNSAYVFVVYRCGNDWGNFRNYTACATKPEDLEF